MEKGRRYWKREEKIKGDKTTLQKKAKKRGRKEKNKKVSGEVNKIVEKK